MNEVKKVHLGRQQFVISVEAHRELRKYLDDIAKQPGVQDEVVKEVEARMAELLVEHGIIDDKVVLPEDIHFLKGQLGEPADFKDEDGLESESNKEESAGNQSGPKKLFRDTDNAWLAGVASGLAAYTGIDVLIIRAVFVLSVFASGLGIVAYILIWLLAPEAKTPSDRLQMRGKAVTVDSLKVMVDRADLAGASERASRNIGRAFGRLVELVAKLILIIIGSVFVAAGIVTMLWSMAAGVYLLIHGGQIGTEIAFPIGTKEIWLTVLGFVTTAILGFFLLMSGLTMTTRKWRLPTWSVVTLVSIFLVSGSVAGALAADTVPQIRDRYRAAHHSSSRDVGTFNKLELKGGDTRYHFVSSDKYSVEFSYLGNVDTKPLTTDIKNEVLTVDSSEFVKTTLCSGLCFYSDHDLEVTIHAPRLDEVTVAGHENSFSSEGQLNQQEMVLTIERHSDNYVKLANANAATVEYRDLANSSPVVIKLSGIKPINDNAKLSFSDEDHVLRLDAADDFVFNSPLDCDESEPVAYLDEGVRNISIREKHVTSADELRGLRSPDESNAYNCVVLR